MFTSNSRCLKSTQQSPEQPTGLRMSLQDQASGNTAIKQENLKVAFVHSCGLTNINNSPPTLRSSIKKQLWRPSSNPGAIYTTWATLSLTEDPQTKQSSPKFFFPYIQQEHSHAPQASLVFLVLLHWEPCVALPQLHCQRLYWAERFHHLQAPQGFFLCAVWRAPVWVNISCSRGSAATCSYF